MYLTIGQSVYKADTEVFKKHFAKAIGIDMVDEKVKVVQISLAKLVFSMAIGYSRSVDKVREHIEKNTSADVN
jgi:spermidine/putrescine-binding protein